MKDSTEGRAGRWPNAEYESPERVSKVSAAMAIQWDKKVRRACGNPRTVLEPGQAE